MKENQKSTKKQLSIKLKLSRGTVTRALSSLVKQNKIERVEDILKAKTKTDNLLRAIILSIVLTLVAVTATVLVVRRLQKLRHKKQRAMEELAADYEDKE